MRLKILLPFLFSSLLSVTQALGQSSFVWTTLPPLPDTKGFAGMFAGVSNGVLFCMGGANFPDKMPWEGGIKKWYGNIYRLHKPDEWVKLNDTLPMPLGYGVSISYKNKIYLIGGSYGNEHSDKVLSLTWKGNTLLKEQLQPLPVPLANMAGALVNNLIILAGGSSSAAGPALKKCFALDLTAIKNGWFEMPTWPGPERTLPICAVSDEKFYLFSGEKTGVNAGNEKYRYILQDAYCFTPQRVHGKWTGTWKPIAPMPKGASAAGNPLPVLRNGTIVVSGGVDVYTALQTNPVVHHGISRDVQLYYPQHDSWQLFINRDTIPARVTLPVVQWKNQWVFISGEIKPGIRTNTVISLND